MDDKLPKLLKENLSNYDDFSDMVINEHEWVITKFTHVDKSVSFKFYEASQQEIENLGKKYGLTIQEDYLDGRKTFRMVRGNTSQECLTEYFKLINYVPSGSVTKKEFDSIELIEKEIYWGKNSQENIYTALKDNASIFIIYDHGVHERLIFNADQNFKIDESGNFIIFDKANVITRNI